MILVSCTHFLFHFLHKFQTRLHVIQWVPQPEYKISTATPLAEKHCLRP